MAVKGETNFVPQYSRREVLTMARDIALLFWVGGAIAFLRQSNSGTPDAPAIISRVPNQVSVVNNETNTNDSNNPESPNYRGYHVDIVIDNEGNKIMKVCGDFPFNDDPNVPVRFHAIDDLDIELPATDTDIRYHNLGGGAVMLRVGWIKNGEDKIVGKVNAFHVFPGWYPTQYGDQSHAVGHFQNK